ncbi:MAG: DUF427 domain-containing protein, partial [Acidimicrobiia bacterium]
TVSGTTLRPGGLVCADTAEEIHVAIRAAWNGVALAEADDQAVKVVEGNVYFPLETVNRELLEESTLHTRCYWKGKASYYHVVVDGEINPDAAWYYPRPWPLARWLNDYVAFRHGVRIERT